MVPLARLHCKANAARSATQPPPRSALRPFSGTKATINTTTLLLSLPAPLPSPPPPPPPQSSRRRRARHPRRSSPPSPLLPRSVPRRRPRPSIAHAGDPSGRPSPPSAAQARAPLSSAAAQAVVTRAARRYCGQARPTRNSRRPRRLLPAEKLFSDRIWMQSVLAGFCVDVPSNPPVPPTR